MEQPDFDKLLSQARQVGEIFKTVFADITGEDLDIESAVRHYPLIALGLAAGAGAAAGWWIGRRRDTALPGPQRALPPPEALEPPPAPPSEGGRMAGYFEGLVPAIERMRKAVPDSVAEEATQAARTWMDTVLEPKLKQGLDSVAANLSESRFGSAIRQAVQRGESSDEVLLDDPPDENGEKPRA